MHYDENVTEVVNKFAIENSNLWFLIIIDLDEGKKTKLEKIINLKLSKVFA